MKEKLAKYLLFLPCMVLLAGMLVSPALPAQAAPPTPIPQQMSNTTISVVSSSASVRPGEEFEVLIIIETDVATTGMQVGISFDPEMVEVLSVSEGDFYKNWAASNGVSSMLIPDPVVDNDAGVVPVIAVIILGAGAGEGPTGSGSVLALQVQAKPEASGEVEFALTDIQVSDAGPHGVTAELQGVQSQNGIVSIGGEPVAAQPEAVDVSEEGSAEPTVERRATPAPQGSGGGTGGFPFVIVIPVAVALVVGVVIVVTRKK